VSERSKSVDPSAADVAYQSQPNWFEGQRYFEAAESSRLNSAHWTYAQDESINVWLMSQLSTIRARAVYEAKQNGVVLGMQNTHADDVVGQDGPSLQVQSSNAAYNDALEGVWRNWFAAPTQRQNLSGAALLKLWIRNLWRCGEFVARIATVSVPDDDPVAMRLLPIHPRRLASPADLAGDANVVMGIRFDADGTPTQYFIDDQQAMGTAGLALSSRPYPPDLIVHEFVLEEEDQVRGVPLQTTGLQPSADLRDYDDQVQDAARQIADQTAMLYTDHPDAPYFAAPEGADIERRVMRMIPPGWKPFVYSATQPPVQYPDYRAERQLEIGRPASMPRLLVRLDASKHSWASAKLDMTTYRRAVTCLQSWLSGSERSTGILNRLVDIVAAEARFQVEELRNPPEDAVYLWTWPQIEEVEPIKVEQANQIGLTNKTRTLTDVLASKKKTLTAHVEEMRREQEAFEAVGLPLPSWMGSGGAPSTDSEDGAQPDIEADDEDSEGDESGEGVDGEAQDKEVVNNAS
jgi:hypothetical protein